MTKIDFIGFNSSLEREDGGKVDIMVHITHAPFVDDEEVCKIKKLTEEFSKQVDEYMKTK